MNISNERIIRRQSRHRTLLPKVRGDAQRPRLLVRRSLKHIYALLINDAARKVILALDSKKQRLTGKKTEVSFKLGETVAQKARELGIGQIRFDRGGYLYHGRVKALADGARKGGLKF